TYLSYLYSHEQEISYSSVNWQMEDIMKYVKNMKFNCHFSIHRHLGRFGFSNIDWGSKGILNRFEKESKNLYQLDLIGYFENDDFDIVDIHFRKYLGGNILVYNNVYYFMFSENVYEEEGDIYVSSDLKTLKKLNTIYDFLVNFKTNYNYKRKFDSNILKFLINIDKYATCETKIDLNHFKEFSLKTKFHWFWRGLEDG
ncbi:MAG: hypothetical protein RMJ67_05945, partial [Elusimicrobiota bacterium]|nr:hypothetical protein [Endomicrobiia bacterium]MDW8166034.1 hypothetical protein [Elusimicrobiota bacterium]